MKFAVASASHPHNGDGDGPDSIPVIAAAAMWTGEANKPGIPWACPENTVHGAVMGAAPDVANAERTRVVLVSWSQASGNLSS